MVQNKIKLIKQLKQNKQKRKAILYKNKLKNLKTRLNQTKKLK